MIKVECPEEILAGKVALFNEIISLENNQPVDPGEFLLSFLKNGWRWEVDYSEATQEEILLWYRYDCAIRVIRALREGREVVFRREQKWSLGESQNLKDVAQEIEDAIVAWEGGVSISRDDEIGLVISARE